MKKLEDMDIVEFYEYIWGLKFTWLQKEILRKVAEGSRTLAGITSWYTYHSEKDNDSERLY